MPKMYQMKMMMKRNVGVLQSLSKRYLASSNGCTSQPWPLCKGAFFMHVQNSGATGKQSWQRSNKMALHCKWAPGELKNNREVVIAAVRNNSLAWQFASNELLSDVEVEMAVHDNDVQSLENSPEWGFSRILCSPTTCASP